MTIQELVNYMEKYPADTVVKISAEGFIAKDIATLELRKDDVGVDDGNLVLELQSIYRDL